MNYVYRVDRRTGLREYDPLFDEIAPVAPLFRSAQSASKRYDWHPCPQRWVGVSVITAANTSATLEPMTNEMMVGAADVAETASRLMAYVARPTNAAAISIWPAVGP